MDIYRYRYIDIDIDIDSRGVGKVISSNPIEHLINWFILTPECPL